MGDGRRRVDDMTLVCERCGKTIADVPDVRIEGECCHLWREGSRLKAKVWQAVNEKESDSNGVAGPSL